MSTPDEITPAPTAGFDDEAVLLIGHGSRREKSNEQVRELAADLESRLDPGRRRVPRARGAGDRRGLRGARTRRIAGYRRPLLAVRREPRQERRSLAIEQARSERDLEIANGAHLGVHPAILDLLDDRAASVEDELRRRPRGRRCRRRALRSRLERSGR